MAIQNFQMNPARIGRFKGALLKHAVPKEVLAKGGEPFAMPNNSSDTYIFRRWLPYGATSTSASTINQFFQNGTGNRDATLVQAHQISEGVTPQPDSIIPQDITVVIKQYGFLYGTTDKVVDLYEDDVPAAMLEQGGERMALVREMVRYGELRAGTNQFFGGSGTTVATVNAGLTLGFLRKIAKNLQANHGETVNKELRASPDFGTSAVPQGYTVYCHTDLEPDIRDLPNFTPAEKYASGKPMDNELGMCERFRFITSPELIPQQDAGAAIATYPGFNSTSGTSMDVYTILVTAKNAYGHIALRNKNSIKTVSWLPPGETSKSDPLGQRGYAAAKWYDAALVQNQGWLAVGFVGSKSLS